MTKAGIQKATKIYRTIRRRSLRKEMGLFIRTISRYETGEIQIPKVTELALRYIAEKVKKQEM